MTSYREQNYKCYRGCGEQNKVLRKVHEKEGINDDLKMFQLSKNNADRGNLPPSSSSICDKIFKWCSWKKGGKRT